MIDFRYHLVSLISVFLALAVGIILGAGPLQGTIGDQLTGQVADLRADRDALRDALTASDADADQRLQFIEAAGPTLVGGSLTGTRVAVVDLDSVDTELEESMVEAIEGAGGTVVMSGALTAAWTDDEHAGFRDTVASDMRARLSARVKDLPEDASTEELLAAALGVALGDADPFGMRSDDAKALERDLTQADLIAVEGEVTLPADVVLMLSAATGDTGGDAQASPAPEESALNSMVTLARTVQTITPVVVAGPTVTSGDVVSSVRADGDTAERVSTVSGIQTPVGRIVVPLALSAHLRGEVGQYGFEDGTTPLPPIARPADAGGTETDGGTDGATDGASDAATAPAGNG